MPKAKNDCLQREEMAGLRWKDVDFRWQRLAIRDKVEGRRSIPLTPYVASLMLKMQRMSNKPPNM